MVRRHRKQTEELKEAADKFTVEAGDIANKAITMEEQQEREKWDGVESACAVPRARTTKKFPPSHTPPRRNQIVVAVAVLIGDPCTHFAAIVTAHKCVRWGRSSWTTTNYQTTPLVVIVTLCSTTATSRTCSSTQPSTTVMGKAMSLGRES
jgi:hypothetical protein